MATAFITRDAGEGGAGEAGRGAPGSLSAVRAEGRAYGGHFVDRDLHAELSRADDHDDAVGLEAIDEGRGGPVRDAECLELARDQRRDHVDELPVILLLLQNPRIQVRVVGSGRQGD